MKKDSRVPGKESKNYALGGEGGERHRIHPHLRERYMSELVKNFPRC